MLLSLNQKINEHAKKFAPPYITFALFGVFTYPFYYWIWTVTYSKGYENLPLRLVTVVLCVLLGLKEFWPRRLQDFFPLYWYITLLYSLPFLFTFLLLKNDMSYVSSMNTMTILVLSILLLDLLALSIILPIGIALGVGCFLLTGQSIHPPSNTATILVTYGSILFFGSLFSYRKDQLREVEKQMKKAEAERAQFENTTRTKLKEQQKYTKMANQVAHDIRSPLASILMVLKSCAEIPEDKRIVLRTASMRMNDIANQLLSQYGEQGASQAVRKDSVLLSAIFLQLLSEKKAQFQNSMVAMDANIHPSGQFAFISIELSSFQRMISNLINNAVDAYAGNPGKVTLSLKASNEWVTVMIQDEARGMPASVLQKIRRKEAVTAGKVGGHGIGLIQVWETVEQNLGKMNIDSLDGVGTTVTLEFPRVTAPAWCVEGLWLRANDRVVIVDDDPSIHAAWDARFELVIKGEPSIHLQHFEYVEDALHFFERLTDDETKKIYLLTDYEFLNQAMNGLELIQKSNITRALLVTSHYIEADVRKEAEHARIKILPKQLAPEVEIGMESEQMKEIDAVVVDDDKLFAKLTIKQSFKGKKVLYFDSPEMLLNSLSNISKNIPIYLDQNYKISKRLGLDVAKLLHEKGYEKIFLLTAQYFKKEEIPSYVSVILKYEIG